MRFLADENFPRAAINHLRAAEYDVVAVVETIPGVLDDEVLQYAELNVLSLLTFDKDFGDLVFRKGASTPPSIIYFRLQPHYPEEPADLLIAAIEQGVSLEGRFSILYRDRIRQRPL